MLPPVLASELFETKEQFETVMVGGAFETYIAPPPLTARFKVNMQFNMDGLELSREIPPPTSVVYPFFMVNPSMVVAELSDFPVMHRTLPSPDIIVVVASPVALQLPSNPPFK